MARERGTFANFALQRHPAAVHLGKRLDQRQAQAWPASLATYEAVEDVRLDMEGDAAPGVGDLQLHLTRDSPGR